MLAKSLRASDSSMLATQLNLSPENVQKLFHESHFQTATANMSPLGKAFLRLYLSVVTNCPTISKFLEQMVTASHTSRGAKLAPTTLANLEAVAAAVHSLQEQSVRSKQDIYLLTCHPNAGNALYNTFHKEESLSILGLKVEDPMIEKAAREVEANKKAAAVSRKSHSSSARGRGRGGRGRGSDYHSRTSYNDREGHSNGGQPSHNNQRKNYSGYRGGRWGHSGNFNPNFGSNFNPNFGGNFNPNFGQGQTNAPNNFQGKMLGWIPQGQG